MLSDHGSGQIWNFKGRPHKMRKPSNLNRALQLKIEMLSDPRLLCVIRGAMEPMMGVLGFSESECRSVVRAVDEALSNIMRHTYGGRQDQVIEISCTCLGQPNDPEMGQGIEILLYDYGPALDPAKLRGRPLDEIRPGGLGLHFIRDAMDTVEFTREGRSNRLRLVKYVKASKRLSETVREKTS